MSVPAEKPLSQRPSDKMWCWAPNPVDAGVEPDFSVFRRLAEKWQRDWGSDQKILQLTDELLALVKEQEASR